MENIYRFDFNFDYLWKNFAFPKTFFMENILPIHIQEVIFGSSEPKISKQLSMLHKQGKIRKIAPRIYSSKYLVNCMFLKNQEHF